MLNPYFYVILNFVVHIILLQAAEFFSSGHIPFLLLQVIVERLEYAEVQRATCGLFHDVASNRMQ
jgi:hypothetical protein